MSTKVPLTLKTRLYELIEVLVFWCFGVLVLVFWIKKRVPIFIDTLWSLELWSLET